MRCAIVGCNSDNQSKKKPCDNNIKFFRFPKNSDLSKERLHATKRKDKMNLKHQLLNYSPKNYRGLKDDAVPTQNLFQPQVYSVSSPSTSGENRKLRCEKRQRVQLLSEILTTKDTDKGMDIIINNGGGGDGNNIGGSFDHMVVGGCSSSDTGVQTDETYESMEDLERKLLCATKEIEELKHQLAGVKKVFSQNQINKLNRRKRINWSLGEISNAIAMYAAGPRGYRLALKRGLPYPAVSTLKQWLRKIKIEPGILKNVLKIAEFADMTENDRVCTIMFDEMKIRKEYQYDQTKDCVIQPFDYVQVVIISGVFRAWKQPIFYNFDCKMTSQILMDIIKFVEDSGFHVVAMVSDLGGANRGLHRDLQITESKPYFQNPVNNENIFVLADVPHLLKLIRNNFVDHGFLIGEKVIKKEIVEQAINATSVSDLKITHKITIDQLNVSGPQSQRVKYAAKLFSHTISRAISRCGTLGFLSHENWKECADFFKLVNDWFDIFNVSTPASDSRAKNKAYGLALEDQNAILNKMSAVITQMKVIGTRGQLPFQKGILISNSALQMLLQDIKRRFSSQYLLTRRLNQDVLENFFGVIRAKGGLHDHPSPLEFRYRLRSYILGRNEGAYSDFSNVETDDTPDIPLSGSLISKLNPSPDLSEADSIREEAITMEELNELAYDGLENLAGFVCHKLKDSALKSSANHSYSWIDHLSEGGLTKPSPTFMSHIEQLNEIFLAVHKEGIVIGENCIHNLLLNSGCIDCPDKAKRLFFRSRMFFRIKELNKSLKDKKNSKRKWKKITS